LESLIFCNRTLGYVNAPALFQKAIADSLDADIDVESYKQRRDLIYDTLTRLGFSCIKPQGTFYIFPKSPIEDDIQFINMRLNTTFFWFRAPALVYRGTSDSPTA